MGKIREAFEKAMKEHPKGRAQTAGGSEVPDPVPCAPPIGYRDEPSMFDIVRKMIEDERVRVALEEEGLEDPDEADDFDVGDDYEPHSPYEHNFDHVVDPAELRRLRDEIDLRERELADAARGGSAPPSGRPASGSRGKDESSAGEPASTSGQGQPAAPPSKVG